MTKQNKKVIWGIAYLFSIVLANLFVIWFGIVHFVGLSFPAGVVFIGLTFSFRDYVQKYWGDGACWSWMLTATVITYFFNKQIAFASVSAFIVSETIDWFAFKTLKMNFRKRVYISNLLSCPLDSIIFVSIAFGWYWPVILGQALIKYLSGLLVLPFIKNER